jgi:5-methylcytosine-specific restriction endonuclease McrA
MLPVLSPDDLAYMALLRHDPCSYCGEPAGTIDHIHPLNSGGSGGWENLTASCRSCNPSKGTATLLAFLGRA